MRHVEAVLDAAALVVCCCALVGVRVPVPVTLGAAVVLARAFAHAYLWRGVLRRMQGDQ